MIDNMINIIILILGIFQIAVAEIHLQGELGSESIDSSGNPYIIEKSIEVPQGKKVVIKEGCVLLFKKYSGLKVNGDLIINGTDKNRVVFTSFNDSAYNNKSDKKANALDWNGVNISSDNSKVDIQYLNLLYSVYGIKSQNLNISIKKSVFMNNGQSNITLLDQLQNVQDSVPYSFNAHEDTSSVIKSIDTSKIILKKPFVFPTKQVIRYSSLLIGVVGVSVGSYYLYKAQKTNTQLKDNNYFIQQGTIQKRSPGDIWSEEKSQYNKQVMMQNIFFAVGLIGATGFSITFLF